MAKQLHVEWGRTTFCGTTFKDGKVWSTGFDQNGNESLSNGEGILNWDWIEDGTRHNPGISETAVKQILNFKPDTLILTRGFDGVLQVPDDLVKLVESNNCKPLVMTTPHAVAMFNYLITKNQKVAALIHSTC